MKKSRAKNKYKEYEREKRRLQSLKLPSSQYEAAVKELACRLKI